MLLPAHHDEVVNTEDIERQARRCLHRFFERTGNCFPPEVKLECDNKRTPGNPDLDIIPEGDIAARWEGNQLCITICTKGLVGSPLPVLQGGLDLELAACLLSMEHRAFQLNFERQILPLFSVSGSAVQILRRLVRDLEAGLKRYLSTQLVVELGHGASQQMYYYFKINPPMDGGRHYQNLAPHRWMRALFLSRLNAYYMSLALLDQQETMMGMVAYWWRCHDYVAPEDRRLLESLFASAGLGAHEPFARRVVGLFSLVKAALL